MFPVQGLASIPGLDAYDVYDLLLKSKIGVVLKRSHLGKEAQIALLITADHQPSQVDAAAAALTKSVHSVLRR